MVDIRDMLRNWQRYRATKSMLFWCCLASVVATMIVGFGWGGWVRGGTAQEMASKAAGTARMELATAVCLHEFSRAPDAEARLASLKAVDYWKRDKFVEEGGWFEGEN